MIQSKLLVLDEENGNKLSFSSSGSDRPLLHNGVRIPKLHHILSFRVHFIGRFFRRFGYALVPQLIRTRFYHDSLSPARLHPTSWLDGLRGIAALIVFNFHYFFAFSDMSNRAYGDEKHRYLIELPIIRMVHSGMPMVMLFFTVAGYVLSARALQMMRSNDANSRDKLLQSLSASTFRRFFRLYLPVLAVTLLTDIFAYLGAFEPARPYVEDYKKYFPGAWGGEKQQPRFNSFGDQLGFWFRECRSMMDIWQWDVFYPIHDAHLWTVKVEVRSSFVLYAALLGLARTRESIRLACLLAISYFCLRSGRWETVAFFWGASIAQSALMFRDPKDDIVSGSTSSSSSSTANNTSNGTIDSEKLAPILPEWQTGPSPSSSPNPSSPPPSSSSSSSIFTRHQAMYRLRNDLHLILMLFSFYLMSAPKVDFANAPGYVLLSRLLVPSFMSKKERFLPLVGTALFLLCLTYSSASSIYRRLLTSVPAQYMGRIMFAFYLVHGPIMHAAGYMVPHLVWARISATTAADPMTSVVVYTFGLLVGWAVTLLITLWAADIFTREIDGRVAGCLSWLERVCFVRSEENKLMQQQQQLQLQRQQQQLGLGLS